MSIRTNLDDRRSEGKNYVKGNELIEITADGESEGYAIYYSWNKRDDSGNLTGEKIKYTGLMPIGINDFIDENGLIRYEKASMILNCETAKEKMPELKLKLIYPPESEPKCLDIKDGEEYTLVNKWEDEVEKKKFKIMYQENGKDEWKEWNKKIKAQVNADGVYVHIIKAKLQHEKYPETESLTRTFVYVIKPERKDESDF